MSIDIWLLFILLGVVAACGMVGIAVWPLYPRKRPLGEKRKWLERHGVRTMHPKGK